MPSTSAEIQEVWAEETRLRMWWGSPNPNGRERRWEHVGLADPDDAKAVYIIGHIGGPYKVGISENPNRRLSEIESLNPGVELFAAVRCPTPRWVEGRSHQILRDHWISGEWFNCPLSTIVAAVEAAIREAENPI